jgi:hypothetical protein
MWTKEANRKRTPISYSGIELQKNKKIQTWLFQLSIDNLVLKLPKSVLLWDLHWGLLSDNLHVICISLVGLLLGLGVVERETPRPCSSLKMETRLLGWSFLV